MTIKQQGGVFGRNPTFNDLSAADADIGDLTVNGSTLLRANATVSSLSGSTNLTVENPSANAASALVRFLASGSGDGSIGLDRGLSLFFNTGGSTSAKILYNGDLSLQKGNLIVTNGKGIDFSATSGTGTSELFDDYEEGTWTPALKGLTTEGVGTYTRQLGWYTKVGNVCHLTFSLIWTAHTGTGIMYIGGLPFNGAYYALNVQQAGTVVDQNITLTALNNLGIAVGNSSPNVSLYNMPSGGGANGAISVKTSGTISGQITYRTA